MPMQDPGPLMAPTSVNSSGNSSFNIGNQMSLGQQLGENMGYSYNFSDSQSNASNQGQSQSVTRQDPGLLARYDQQYATALAQQQANYNRIVGGYGDILGRIGSSADRIGQGYQALDREIQGRIAGTFAPQYQDIADQYARASGAATQGLVGRGLGNTTVQDSVNRGLLYDKVKAQNAMRAQEAQLGAGYSAQFGSAGLQAQSQAMGLAAGAGNNYMSTLGNYRLPMPTWAPNVGESSSSNSGQSQSTAHSQGESWNYGYNIGQQMSQGSNMGGGRGGSGGVQGVPYYPSSGGGYPVSSGYYPSGGVSTVGNVTPGGDPLAGYDPGYYGYQPGSEGGGGYTPQGAVTITNPYAYQPQGGTTGYDPYGGAAWYQPIYTPTFDPRFK